MAVSVVKSGARLLSWSYVSVSRAVTLVGRTTRHVVKNGSVNNLAQTLSFSSLSACVAPNISGSIGLLSRITARGIGPKSVEQQRTVIKFGYNKGGRKSVKAVLTRFFRLQNGLWIRPKTGRNRKITVRKKSRVKRLQRHVICNKHQCELLDKMVTPFWHRPKYYVDDPYKPYHGRPNFVL
ncbi:MRPL35 (predicted) [Pycnogonum litorale]